MKYEGSTLNATNITPKSIVNYEALGLEESFQGTYFDMIFSNLSLCPIDEKVCKGFIVCNAQICKVAKYVHSQVNSKKAKQLKSRCVCIMHIVMCTQRKQSNQNWGALCVH